MCRQKLDRLKAFTEIQGRENWYFSNWIENVKIVIDNIDIYF